MHGKSDYGKGDRYRPYSPKAWDKAWLRIWGKKCNSCKGTGWVKEYDPELGALQGVEFYCPKCKGNGYLERKRK